MELTISHRSTARPGADDNDEPTVHQLEAAMRRAWATSEPLLLVVRAGKRTTETNLLAHLHMSAMAAGAWAVETEANVVGLDAPYGAIARVLTSLVPRIAGEHGSMGTSIRHRLAPITTPLGRLLVILCPALAPHVPASTEVEPLPCGFAKERFETLLVRVFAALASPERPIAVFLRHADQADPATLRGLARMLSPAETRHLVVVALVRSRDKPRSEQAWNKLCAGRGYVVERVEVDSTDEPCSDEEPISGTYATQFPRDTRRAIAAAACSGQTAETEAIAAALEISTQGVHELLLPALEADLLVKQGAGYAFVDARAARTWHEAMGARMAAAMHLRLGKFLAWGPSRQATSETGFVAAAHLTQAAENEALEDVGENERVQFAEYLVDAARKAMVLAAYDVAEEYLEGAAHLLDDRGSAPSIDLVRRIELGQFTCACAMGERARASELLETLRARTLSPAESMATERMMVDLLVRLGAHTDAVKHAARVLGPLGIHLEVSPSRETLEQAFERVWDALGERAIEEITELDEMTNPEAVAATEMLFALHPGAQALGAGPADLVAAHLTRLGLVHGNADASSVGYAAFGAAVIGRKKDHRTGYRFGKVALYLCEQRARQLHHPVVSMKFAEAMSIWTHPLQTSIDQCARTYESAMIGGNARAASRLAAMMALLTLLEGNSLDDVEEAAVRRRRAVRSHECDDEGMGDLCEAIERFVGQQKGRPTKCRGLVEAALELGPTPRLGHLACRVLDLLAHVLGHEYDAAVTESAALRPYLVHIGAQVLLPEVEFWSMLALTLPRSSGVPEELDGVIEDYERWADRCPQTYQHKHALLLAERYRLQGRDMEAMRAYDQAIHEARENGFAHVEAIAAESATRFYSARDFSMIATTYFRNARNAYARWGATHKVVQLDRRFFKLGNGSGDPSASTPPPSLRGALDVDVFMAVKTAQAVSKEIVLQRLLVTLMRIVLDHGGAERCHVLLEQEDGELSHAGKAITTSKGVEIEVPGPAAKNLGDILPATILEHVRRNHESVNIDDATVDRTWAEDPYLANTRPRSILCFPIIRQTDLVGMFYLENNSARGMFTPRRLALLEFLATQAAISLEHAKLYADLARENAERRRAEQVVRKSEERLRRLVEIADVIPWEVDADTGIFTFIGSQAEQRLGWPASLWSNPHFLRESVHPEDRDHALAALTRACAEGKHPGIDFRLLASDGTPVWLHMVIGAADQENGQRLLSGFFFDISERKRNEQTLRDKLAIIEQQKKDIRALSTPLLDVSEGIVAMPILGELDQERASRVMDILLETITRRSVRGAILDLTGVSTVGEATAEQIGRIVRAVELVGARAIVAGIRADVARAFVSLDICLGQIETRASMKDALRALVKELPCQSTPQAASKNHSRPLR